MGTGAHNTHPNKTSSNTLDPFNMRTPVVSRKDLTATRNAKHLERCGVLVKVVREEGTDGGNFDGAEEQRAMFGPPVYNNANNGDNWAEKFVKAMVQMSSIEVLTGSNSEIRMHRCLVQRANLDARIWLYRPSGVYSTNSAYISRFSEEGLEELNTILLEV
ncbi:hypothetical protein HKD37_20G055224 [Glycine soja]